MTAETVMTKDERIALLEREVSAAQDCIERLSLLNVEYAGKIDRLGTENVLPCWADHSAPWHRLSLRKGCAGCEIERLRNGLELIAAGTYTEKGAEDWAKFVLRNVLPADPNGFEARPDDVSGDSHG